MKLNFIIFLFSISLVNSYDIFDPVRRPLLSFFVGNTHIPACLINCTSQLRSSLEVFLNGEIQMDSMDKVCSAYEKANLCVNSSTECEAHDMVYKKLTSGFNWACENGVHDPFEHLFPCIVTMGKEPSVTQYCYKNCSISEANRNFASHKNTTPINLISGLEDYCEPLACLLNCTRSMLNQRCPTSGSRLINVIASAFDELIDELRHTTPTERHQIMEKVPESCQLYFRNKKVNQLRFDNQFVYDMFFMITSRKQRTQNGMLANSEAEIIVNDLLNKMENVEKIKIRPKWDLRSVSMACSMAVIMIVILIGLGFSIYWCLSSTNNDEHLDVYGNEISDCNAAILEPNIRMKLKLPRMTAAIKDSSQEVLELRVPRNGNQMSQGDEQQTVVLPRWKRRRTFSVPLETRDRANSTGSDQFPHLVILRTREN